MNIRIGTAAIAAFILSAPVHAGLIGFDLLDSPDIFSSFIDVTYDADTNEFLADGFAIGYDNGIGDPDPVVDGGFDLMAVINESGESEGGSLSITGTVGGGLLGGTLIAGDLLDFGFIDAPGGEILEFLFEVTDGSLADDFGGIGSLIGVILDVNSVYTGDWTQSFNNLIGGIPGTGSGNADTAPLVPAPSALALMALGLAGRGRRRRA